MAMLQMQANVQHESPFQGWYTTWDLNSDANGTVRPSDNVNRISRIRQYSDATLPPFLDSNTFYNKGLLKQTMLKHEAEFRGQIRELHRLYRRQKELMDEIKTIDFFKQGCNVEMFRPNHVVRPKSSNHLRVPQQTGSVFPEVSEAEGSVFPSHSYDGSKEQAGLDPTHRESSSKAYVLTELNCKKLGRRFLDLELPADGYFDSEEDGFQEVKLDPAVTNIPSNALKKINVGDRGDKEPSHSVIGCASVFPEENFVTSSASSKLKVTADLNVPVELEEDIIPEFSSRQKLLHIEHKMQRECVPSNDKAGQDGNDLNALPRDLYTRKLSIQHTNNERAQDCAILHGLNETDANLCIGNFWHVTRDVSSSYYEPTSGSPWRFAFKRSPIAVQELPCFKGKSPKPFIISPELDFVSPNFSTNVTGSQDASRTHGENTVQNPSSCSPRIAEMPVPDNRSGKTRDPLVPADSAVGSLCVHDAELEKMEATNPLDFESMLGIEGNKVKDINRIPNINMEFNPMPEREKEAQIESVAESEACSKYQGCRVIDLNSCLSMDESLLLPSHSTKVDSEPPASLGNKECLSPRDKSNENQLEKTLLFSGQEDKDLQAELARYAAEALVCISSSKIQSCLENTTCQLFRASNSLYWFARVASSVSDDPGSELGVNIGVKDYGDQEEYQSDGIDYFEAMILNLPEINVEETWCASIVQKEPESSAIHSTNQSNRGRTRRGRRREDFQSELPSLDCLPRYKSTKDLHLIGGLAKAGDAHHESSSSRNACKSGCRKGRRRYNLRSSNAMDNTTNALLKQQPSNGELGNRIKD